jgi:hypothetical protein
VIANERGRPRIRGNRTAVVCRAGAKRLQAGVHRLIPGAQGSLPDGPSGRLRGPRPPARAQKVRKRGPNGERGLRPAGRGRRLPRNHHAQVGNLSEVTLFSVIYRMPFAPPTLSRACAVGSVALDHRTSTLFLCEGRPSRSPFCRTQHPEDRSRSCRARSPRRRGD